MPLQLARFCPATPLEPDLRSPARFHEPGLPVQLGETMAALR